MYIEHKYIVKGVSALPLNLHLFYIIYRGLRYQNIISILIKMSYYCISPIFVKFHDFHHNNNKLVLFITDYLRHTSVMR